MSVLRGTLAGITAFAVSCGSADDRATPTRSISATPSATAVLSPEQGLDASLRGLAGCNLKPEGTLEANCLGAEAARSWGRDHRAWVESHPDEVLAVARRYLGDPSPAVRLQAVELIAHVTKAGNEPVRVELVALAKREKSAPVLDKALACLSRDAASPDVQAVFLDVLDHGTPSARLAAIDALVPSNAPPKGEVRDAIIRRFGEEKNDLLRWRLCSSLRVGDDAELLGLVDALLEEPNVRPEQRGACAGGLIKSWADADVSPPSRRAYQRTLALLRDAARAGHSLDDAVFELTALGAKAAASDAWRDAVKDFYRREDVVARLVAIARSTEAAGSDRTLAFSVAKTLHATEAEWGLRGAEVDALYRKLAAEAAAEVEKLTKPAPSSAPAAGPATAASAGPAPSVAPAHS